MPRAHRVGRDNLPRPAHPEQRGIAMKGTVPCMLLLSLFLLSAAALGTGRDTVRPRLVVVLSIDQMRADYLVRYVGLYGHGFARLLQEGVHFRTAELNYAGSSTGPGHATLGTGVYPWKSGIVANNYTERATGKRVYCVADSTAGPVGGDGGRMSPRNLLVTGLGDWLKSASPGSRVISISYKDRAAILMGGKFPDAAYWYDRRSGRMSSSSYYLPALPAWMGEFNASGWISKNLPRTWGRLRPDSVYEAFGPDDAPGEALWNGKRTFPHVIEPGREIGRLFNTPWGNDFLFDVARAAIRGEQLGERGAVDLLWLSLSTTDNIGSDFGPSSHEMIDNLLRLDISLGRFLADLDASHGPGEFMLVLVGDHGVMHLPEYEQAMGHPSARRFDNSRAIERTVEGVDSVLRRELGILHRIVKGGQINESALRDSPLIAQMVEDRLRAALLGVDGVADVYFRSELLLCSGPDRPYMLKYCHSYHPERSPDYIIRDCEYCLNGSDSTGTSHGSPYTYDTTVPMVFWGTGRAAGVIDRMIHTVDLAVTLAALYKLPVPVGVDGVPLQEIVE
jgi:predicted AlkP superfamily pyrophosphatase or phosphodiesterase